MHVSGAPLDLNWFLQFIVTAFVLAFGLLHLLRNTASKYFVVDANFESPTDSDSAGTGGDQRKMPGFIAPPDACAVCSSATKKQCAGCKSVKYCSEACQRSHWNSGHKTDCKDFKLSGKVNSSHSLQVFRGMKGSAVPLIPGSGTWKILKQSKKVLFPYEEFVELFNWNKPGFPPCGLLNCGNSCFANVVLQCLTYTRPLVAYLLEKGHRRECRRNDWCFLCEFETHVERASHSSHPFSPLNILSRLPNIGGNLGYGKQEDAHEFMRYAIDTMQSVCLDEFGGERAVHSSSQETTLIQHIFGGHLQSQVICSKCKNVSNQFENMMDLTVEIHGDAASLEECLDQFTAKEWLHGDNMYKCDGCNDYVLAWKRLTVRRAPNILTIALKRFQSGRFGKLNKRVAFPETLDLTPYMSEVEDGYDVYKLYAVVVHVDMLNASFFGHYICYTKDFRGNWYRIDDCKVTAVELDEVLSQGAYMLLYSRLIARPSCLLPTESVRKEGQEANDVVKGVEACPERPFESTGELMDTDVVGSLPSNSSLEEKSISCKGELSSASTSKDLRELDLDFSGPSSSTSIEVEVHSNGYLTREEKIAAADHTHGMASASLMDETDVMKLKAPSQGFENGHLDHSVAIQHCACEDDDVPQDAPVSALEAGETLHEINSVDSSGKLEGVKSMNGFTSSSCSNYGEGKINRKNSSCGTKPKPLFAPGFLAKRPQSSIKRNGKALAESGQLPAKNVGEMKTKGKPSPVYNNSSSPRFLESGAGNSFGKDLMVTSELISRDEDD